LRDSNNSKTYGISSPKETQMSDEPKPQISGYVNGDAYNNLGGDPFETLDPSTIIPLDPDEEADYERDESGGIMN
jgi:hypothetical protein